MNYGKKLKFILIAGGGMFIAITGISFKTGYIPGHSDFSAYILLVPVSYTHLLFLPTASIMANTLFSGLTVIT